MKDFDDTGKILIFFSPVLKVAGVRSMFKATCAYLIFE